MSVGTPTVFVVDDDPSHLTGLVRFVHASGFSVQPFSSAADFS